MKPYAEGRGWVLYQGDCREIMPQLDAGSVDAVVTDPPYGLSFMGKGWDQSVPGVEFWTEAMQATKPGAHLLAFGGTRKVHRMAAAIEDAGWDIRDRLHWVYGSGFPKSLDVSKAIDKMDAAEEQLQRRLRFTEWVRSTGTTSRQIDAATGTCMGGHYTTPKSQPAIMTREHLEACRTILGDVPQWVEREADRRSVESKQFADREVLGSANMPISPGFSGQKFGKKTGSTDVDITAPATPEAQKWDGWGTALKPAVEPIVMARKPFKGTVAANVLEHGTGALNVDGCRVGTEKTVTCRSGNSGSHGRYGKDSNVFTREKPPGRWPANIIHDGSDEATEGMGEAARYFYCPKASTKDRECGCDDLRSKRFASLSGADTDGKIDAKSESFRASRKNSHPTVKPNALMRYLCRLITPVGGTVLDPFSGSGSTGKAAIQEGFRFIGVEMSEEYCEIAAARLRQAEGDK